MNAETPNIDFAAVAALALSQQAALLEHWFPAGKKVGREFLIGDVNGTPGESLSINTTNGRWADFAAGAAGGDLVSLYAAIHQLTQGEAARRLAKELGQPLDERMSRAVPAAPSAKAKAAEWTPILPVPLDAPQPPKAHPIHGVPTHIAQYRDIDNRLLGLVFRCEPPTGRKQVPTLTFCEHEGGHREWQWKSLPKPRSLYGAELLGNTEDVVMVVEGEPKCDAARRLVGDRLTVVAWPGGAQAEGYADWSLLRDRTVVVWPDADKSGLEAGERIVKRLKAFGAHARLVQPPVHVANAWDLADAEREGWTGAQVMEQCNLGQAAQVNPELRRSASLPAIRVVAGEIDTVATAGEEALVASKLPVFRRDKMLVRPISQKVPASGGRMTVTAGLDTVTQFGLIDLLNQAVEWVRYDKRDAQWRPINPPPDVASIILSRAAMSKLPPIAGVITTPTLRPDGSILMEGGYDFATRLYHIRDASLHMPRMPDKPTRADAVKGLELLRGLLADFPFVVETDAKGKVSKVSESVALSGIITTCVRGALSVAPMHAFKANTAGSGKSYLVDLASLISTGRPCPVMAVADKEDETEKRLVGLLLAGFPIISLDNVNGELGGDLLCQAIERPAVRVRGLGQSVIAEIESRASMFATGNSLRVRGDMTRRTLIGALDPKVERPELREFHGDPAAEVIGNRGAYVAACLNIIRAYLAAGKPTKVAPIASFEEWSDWVRGALIWLGCDDPALSMEVARDDDPELSELREVLSVWVKEIGVDQGYTARELDTKTLVHKLTPVGRSPDQLECPDLRAALLKVGGVRGEMDTVKLGKWFLSREGRVVGQYRIERQAQKASGGVIRWSVVDVH